MTCLHCPTLVVYPAVLCEPCRLAAVHPNCDTRDHCAFGQRLCTASYCRTTCDSCHDYALEDLAIPAAPNRLEWEAMDA